MYLFHVPGRSVKRALDTYNTKLATRVGAYGIQNTVTGKWYIGSSIVINERWTIHLRALRRKRHHSVKLQRSFDKHGESAFKFQVLLEHAREEINERENELIQQYDAVENGYCVAKEVKGGFMRGRKWPEATKAACVEAMKGLTRGNLKQKKQGRTPRRRIENGCETQRLLKKLFRVDGKQDAPKIIPLLRGLQCRNQLRTSRPSPRQELCYLMIPMVSIIRFH
jgi:group I intron endonuclease